MSGADPAGAADERDGLAAEYVIGTLEAWQSRAVERAMETDLELRAAVERMEAELAPLAALAPARSPPEGVWERIDQAIGALDAAGPADASGVVVPLRRRERAVRTWAIGASLAAAGFAALAFLPRQGPPRSVMTVMVSDRSQAAWTAEFSPGGGIRLASIPPVGAQPGQALPPIPDDRVQQLWVLPPGATRPTSLGLLPRGVGQIQVEAPAVRPVAGMLIEITLEPAGGSPIDRPTGPVQFIGRLVEAGSS